MPPAEAGFNGHLQVVQIGKVAVVRRQATRQLPDSLNRRQLGAVRRQEQQLEVLLLLLQLGLEPLGVVIPGIIQDHDHLFRTRAMPQEFLQEVRERDCIECGGDGVNEFPTLRTDRPEAGDG